MTTDRASATVAVPTRARAGYLDHTLSSIVPQARLHGAEVIVVCDGPDPATATVAARYPVRLINRPAPSGANAARNDAVAAANGELIVFVDDDVEAPPGWLAAMLDGAERHPDHGVFGGPITARLEGVAVRACGHEPPPITTLDAGPADCDVPAVWSANMAIRASALAKIGPFDPAIHGRGEEEEWQERYRAAGGRIRYLATAGLIHRRGPEDARTRRLALAAYRLGRTARRNDVRKGTAPAVTRELRDLAGGLWHTVRRRCTFGVVFAAHATGRLQEAMRPGARAAVTTPGPGSSGPEPDFLSGASGYVAGIRATSRARAIDALADLTGSTRRRRLHRAAGRAPRRRVLVLAIERTDVPNLVAAAEAELRRSRHDVELFRIPAAHGGKFENLNALLAEHPADGQDWLICLDDDVVLPAHFLDDFLFLAERFDLALAQPAHRSFSHAAWQVTRRRRGSVVRETAFVEIGPVIAFHRRTFGTLLPFPPLRIGWGLDAHWSAVAAARGWRIGVVDATAIEHALRPVAASYDASEAVAEARTFLAGRPYVRAAEAQRTLVTHRRWT